MKPIIAITSGDINGVGYEVILKAVMNSLAMEHCVPVIYGNATIAMNHANMLGDEFRSPQLNTINDPRQAKDGRLNIINCYDAVPLNLGRSTAEGGAASLAALQRACADLQQGSVDALVTGPINKANIQSEQFHYNGHTEYLTRIFGNGKESLMMMVSDALKIALVTNHVAIRDVPALITKDNVLTKIRLLNQALMNDFGIRQPRIGVLSLNPHCGDNGLIGKEEIEAITPAIEQATAEKMMVFGPYSADGFFGSGKFARFDAVLAMYHDQGLVPFKSMDMNGVNFTAGLSIIRTSPDHGTAYELAGKNMADAQSFRNAMAMAVKMVHHRRREQELNANPLIIKQPEDERPKPEFRRFNEPRSTTYRTKAEQPTDTNNTNDTNEQS